MSKNGGSKSPVDLRKCQEDELEVLKAIYIGDVKEENVSENKALKYTVRLLPQRGSSGGGLNHGHNKQPTFLNLSVTIPIDYPKRIPELSFGESKGLSAQEIEELKNELIQIAKECVSGEEVMMYQLLSHAETYLYSHQKRSVGSFHDEMILRQKQMEEKNLQKLMDLKEKERNAIKEEILRKQEEMREELKKMKEKRSQSIVVPEDSRHSSPTSSSSSPVKGDFPVTLRTRVSSKRRYSGKWKARSTSEGSDGDSSFSESSDLSILEFTSGKHTNLFYRGEVLGKSERGTTVYAGLSRNGSLVAITEWKFVAKLDKKGKAIKSIVDAGDNLTLEGLAKQLSSYETEMNLLQKLEHPNIVLYFGLKVFSPVDEPGVLYVYLAEEFVRGNTLQSYLQGTLTFDIAVVRHCAIGILEALRYLHVNDIVHRFLRDTSIFLDTAGGVRVTDYGVERKICELFQTFTKMPEVKDKFPPSIGRGGKKGDIFRFGVIILSLVNGHYVQNPPDIPTCLPPEFQDFLKKCLTPIEHSRWTASELLEHEFLKLPLVADVALKLPCTNKVDEEDKGNEDEEEEADDDNDGKKCVKHFLPHLFKGHSRVQSEFEVLKWLGKGGFGDVLKVKNKLDGRIYALKRIRLNPKNKALNKKITREVKLLSQLNHENVVRYFNSWIETVIESDDEISTADSLSTDPNKMSESKRGNHHVQFKKDFLVENSLGLLDNIEDLAPAINMTETSDWGDMSAIPSPQPRHGSSDESSDESLSDDDDLFGTSFRRITMEDSDQIIFEKGSDSTASELDTRNIKESQKPSLSSSTEGESAALSLSSFLRESQFLYIQMEFCLKRELRTAIDDNLCEDLDRAWRLFREIVEGLVHIHQQGMIHRDLKPGNIFLDSNDHIKIGDFGLATSSIIPSKRSDETHHNILEMEGSTDFTEESQTGAVGTALYAAPELLNASGKATYNQKVDIYSLGIMFFEMFYHPAATSMERVRVIMGLRQKSIVFPSDFDQNLLPQVTHITRWLLDHDHTKRPTSLGLLQSDFLPPPHLEEAELRDIFSRTLRTSKTKTYKYLVASCFQQEGSFVESATYDLDGGKFSQIGGSSVGSFSKSLYFIQRVKKIIQQVFELHGATEIQTPLLMPKSSLYEETDTCVNLMCHSGGLVSIPHDLRVPFVRYVGRYGITHVKRFTIGKVFRERKVYGLHPRELIECAFDVVDSQGSLISDAEVISVVFEILRELPWLRNKSCTLRLGHTKLLQGVMIHHGVDEKLYSKITKLLSEVKDERDSKQQIHTHLCSLGLTENVISMLLQLMQIEGCFSKISTMLKGILKRKGEAASCVKEALHELEILVNNIESFGIKCAVTVSPAMTFCSHIYSGLLFQVVCDLKRRKNKMMVDVIAAGGRYDKLIQEYRMSMYLGQDGNKEEAPCGVGISISLDKLLAGFELEHEDEESNIINEWGRCGPIHVLICALGHHPMTKEKIVMLKELLAHGIHASVIDGSQTLESAEEYCKEIGASFIIILKEASQIRLRLWERGRFNEKKISKPEVIEFISRALAEGNNEATACSDIVSIKQGMLSGSESTCPLASASSHVYYNHGASGILPQYNISFIVQERDKLAHFKRRYENQVMSRLTETLGKIGKQQIVEVLGLEVNSTVINNIASSLPLHDKDEFNKSVGDVIEKHPRLKKYLTSICDELYELIYEKNINVIIIYGLIDNFYRVLL